MQPLHFYYEKRGKFAGMVRHICQFPLCTEKAMSVGGIRANGAPAERMYKGKYISEKHHLEMIRAKGHGTATIPI